MGLAWFYLQLFGANDGTQTYLRVHVFMDGRNAVAVTCPLQICSHAAVAVRFILAVLDAVNLFLNLHFRGIICLPMFSVVIVGIRGDPQAP